MGITVVIPSHRRADRVAAKAAVDGAIICVEESQAPLYRERNPDNEIITHPDSLKGLALKRQWIYERFGDVCMVDDDVTAFHRIHDYRGSKKMSPVEARDMLEATAETCRNFGAYLFGVAGQPIPAYFKPYRPFHLTGFVNGACLGLLKGSNIFFHADALAVEDFFASGVNAYYHRYCFIDMRFAFAQADTFHNPGGQAEFRTDETERRDFEFLKGMFGVAVRLKRDNAGYSGRRFSDKAKRSSRWEQETPWSRPVHPSCVARRSIILESS